MTGSKRPEDVTLLDVLIDGFEKNEVLHGFHERVLPLRDEQLTKARFSFFSEEARRWKGSPVRNQEQPEWQLVAWSDLELLRAGRAIAVRVKAPRFSGWWHEPTLWGEPMQQLSKAWEEADAGARSARHGQP